MQSNKLRCHTICSNVIWRISGLIRRKLNPENLVFLRWTISCLLPVGHTHPCTLMVTSKDFQRNQAKVTHASVRTHKKQIYALSFEPDEYKNLTSKSWIRKKHTHSLTHTHTHNICTKRRLREFTCFCVATVSFLFFSFLFPLKKM